MKKIPEAVEPSAVIGALTDFHSHFLPGMDDGAKDTEESLAMLAEMRRQGVRRVVATSHFYPWETAPDDFLARREAAYQKLCAVLPEDAPEILLGAEVAFYPGIGRSSEISRFCITGTRCCLIELPFSPWDEEVFNELSMLSDRQNITPIIAHLERYRESGNKKVWQEFCRRGYFIQCNASAFVEKPSHILKKMLNEGAISLLGTDTHNMTSRRPNLGEAVENLAALGFGEALCTVISRCDLILPPLS